MKKEYMKPVIRVVMLQQQHVICTSPNDYNAQEVQIFNGGGEEQQINDEGFVW